jgi:hypothetical protein
MTAMSTDPRNNPRNWNVGLVGYGEVGGILAGIASRKKT